MILPLMGAQPLELRYEQPPSAKSGGNATAFFGEASKFPASNWESQAHPVGNGRIGAMVFGNPLRERIQFNDSSLWTGGANPSGGYDVNEFGAYQNFGDLFIDMSGNTEPDGADPVCTSGQDTANDEGIDAAADNNPATKWCMEHDQKEIIWQVDLGTAKQVTGYRFTSANDVPARDPRTWKFEGSLDAKTWRTLDQHIDKPPFEKRGQTNDYEYPTDKTALFRHYRFVFSPAKDATHFQVAEIALKGVAVGKNAIPNLTGYSRTLDLATGIHTTTWQKDGVTYKREVLASKPDEAIVIRITADKPGKIAGKVSIKGGHEEVSTNRENSTGFAGTLSNGLRYAALLQVTAGNGKTTSTADGVEFSGDTALLVLTAATDYEMDPAKKFRNGVDPAGIVAKQNAAASAKTFEAIRDSHLAEFQKLMGRVDLDIGAPPQGKPINQRLEDYKKGTEDPHLESLMFQYGRYLLISCSRGFLPANLQGLWNDKNKPAWYADYHTNINIQMNYWLAEPSNLSECAKPLFDWTIAMIPGSREATVKAFGEKTPGWTMRTSVNIFGGNGWQWNLPASAWLAQHFWDHYAFTGDKEYLSKTAWPVFAGVSEFWLDHLIEKDGKLVVPKGWSPEHGPREDGVAHDQQIVWDLFTNTLEAAKVLGKNDKLVADISAAREKLLGPQVGSWGQIMEWTTERPELEKSHHRHTSHLFAVYPGHQISLNATPELAKAATISLEARGSDGDSRRSWTWPWRTALWARLGKPEKAGEMIRGLLTHNTMPNLFTTHPPFQIDGNLGITAGICETLVQSHAGEISILPAVSPAWKDGSVSGIKARGNFEISATWKAGKMTSAEIESKLGNPAIIRLQGNPTTIQLSEKDGRSTQLSAAKDGTFRFPTKPGMTYQIQP